MTNTESKAQETIEKKPWFFTIVYSWFLTKSKKVINWLVPGDMHYPENEAGELMRRTLSQKSLIDSLSSGWFELSFLYKFFVVTAITIALGLIGLVASAPVFFSLSALFICISAHFVLVAHEQNRRSVAKLMAEEAILLNEDLELKIDLTVEKSKVFNKANVVLEKQTEQLDEQTKNITESAEMVDQFTNDLSVVVEDVKEIANDFVTQEKQFSDALDATTTELTRATTVLGEATQAVESITQSTQDLKAAVQGLAASDKQYAEHAAEFGLFVTNRMQEKKEENLKLSQSTEELRASYRETEREFDEAFAAMMAGQTYSMR